jgi:diguanylate cyclase (GGDEF)-like protein
VYATLTRLGHVAVLCSNGTAALDALTGAAPPQMAILDWMMPGLDGLEVCRGIRAASESYVYIMLVSARGTRADVIEALEGEVDDYLPKPFDLTELRLRLRAGERVLAMQERLLNIQAALSHQARHDALTGLLNRGAVLEQLERELNRAQRAGAPLSVMIADVDRFKVINDRYGHPVGDAVLREASQRMQSALRSFDIIGRYGGEEYLIIAPDTDLVGGLAAAERVRQALATKRIRVGDLDLVTTVSIGLACSERGLETPGELVDAADAALYRAKDVGRNVVSSAPLVSATRRRMPRRSSLYGQH